MGDAEEQNQGGIEQNGGRNVEKRVQPGSGKCAEGVEKQPGAGGGKYDADDRAEDPVENFRLDRADGQEPGKAQGAVQDLGEINRDEIALDPHGGQEQPDEEDRKGQQLSGELEKAAIEVRNTEKQSFK